MRFAPVLLTIGILALGATSAHACTFPSSAGTAPGEFEAGLEQWAERNADELIAQSTSVFIARVVKTDTRHNGTVWLVRDRLLKGDTGPRQLTVRRLDRLVSSCGTRYRFDMSDAQDGRQVLVFYGRTKQNARPRILDMIEADHGFAARVIRKLPQRPN